MDRIFPPSVKSVTLSLSLFCPLKGTASCNGQKLIQPHFSKPRGVSKPIRAGGDDRNRAWQDRKYQTMYYNALVLILSLWLRPCPPRVLLYLNHFCWSITLHGAEYWRWMSFEVRTSIVILYCSSTWDQGDERLMEFLSVGARRERLLLVLRFPWAVFIIIIIIIFATTLSLKTC